MPARRRTENVLESNHKIFLGIYLRLILNSIINSVILAAQKPIWIFNGLHRNDLCSPYEVEKRFTRPAETVKIPKTIPQPILRARDTLTSK